jgi:hypothetical protein
MSLPLLLKMKEERAAVLKLCTDVNDFAVRQAKPVAYFGPKPVSTKERMLFAVLEGFLQRHVSIFGAMLLLEKSRFRSEWLILSRTLFELASDCEFFWNEVVTSEEPTTVLERIRYSWNQNNFHLLKESKNLSEEQVELLRAKIKKVEGLTKKEHEDIKNKQNFMGLNLRERANKYSHGDLYKPVYSRLSKYTHGMTYDEEMRFAEKKSKENFQLVQISEEILNLYNGGMLVMDAMKNLSVVTGRQVDKRVIDELQLRFEMSYPSTAKAEIAKPIDD